MIAKLAKADGLPKGTETEEWRVMSSQVAWALWSAKKAERADWDANAPKHRANTRYVMRQLEQEGLMLRNTGAESVLSATTESWRVASARLAWLLWLRERREVFPADESVEALTWKFVEHEERKRVRAVLTALLGDGIGFVA